MLNTLHSNRFIIIFTIICLINLETTPVLAKVLVFQKDSILQEKIEKREQIISYQKGFGAPSIMSKNEHPIFKTIYLAAETNGINFMDGSEEFRNLSIRSNIIDSSNAIKPSYLNDASSDSTSSFNNSGTIIAIAGLTSFIIGMSVKFKTTESYNNHYYHRKKSHSVSNYALMIFGGILIATGITKLANEGTIKNKSKVGLYIDEKENSLGISYCF